MASQHLCPVWVGRLLSLPLRKWWHPPTVILDPYISPGMAVMDLGCAMGFFSLPLAHLVGEQGHVLCVDCQHPMLDKLQQRARHQQLQDRLTCHQSPAHTLALPADTAPLDFVLAFAVVHEMPTPEGLFSELFDHVKPRGQILLSEPKGHVPADTFRQLVDTAENCGFDVVERPLLKGMHSVVLQRAVPPATHVNNEPKNKE